jgi:hypothetical protein
VSNPADEQGAAFKEASGRMMEKEVLSFDIGGVYRLSGYVGRSYAEA